MGYDCRTKKEIWTDTSRLALDRVLPPFSLPRRALGYARKVLSGGASSHDSKSWSAIVSTTVRPRILILSGCGGDSRRYRAEHFIEALAHLGGQGILLDSNKPLQVSAESLVNNIEGVIFHRAPWNTNVAQIVESANAAGKFILFDTDDLVFDTRADPSQDKGVGKFGKGQAVPQQLQTMQACQFVITSTDYLKSRVQALGMEAHTLRNGYSNQMQRCAEQTANRRSPNRVVLGYASGTPTHDQDLKLIEEGLYEALKRYPHVDLHLMGYIQTPNRLLGFGERVQRRPFVSWQQLPQRLRDIDINLAPFSADSDFSKGKSALKYMEAALVGIPTLASPMPAYIHSIESGTNGIIAFNDMQWRDSLQDLIEKSDLRQKLGETAKQTVYRDDSLLHRTKTLQLILKNADSKPESETGA